MPILVVDGPEKAGKSTLIKHVERLLTNEGYTVKVRKFSGPMTGEDQYLQPLLEDAEHPEVVTIWDRSWVSEVVYSTYFNRPSTLNNNAQRAEKVFTSIVDQFGLKYIVLPNDWRELDSRRDASDLNIDPIVEYTAFLKYAKTFNWIMIETFYNTESLAQNCMGILLDLERVVFDHDRHKTAAR